MIENYSYNSLEGIILLLVLIFAGKAFRENWKKTRKTVGFKIMDLWNFICCVFFYISFFLSSLFKDLISFAIKFINERVVWVYIFIANRTFITSRYCVKAATTTFYVFAHYHNTK